MPKRRTGSLRHLRRSVSPSFWPILRKEYTWTVKPSPGPHPLHRCIPLGIVLRDVLGYAKTMREARRILGERHVEVDGRVVTDYKFPVGLMDVVHIRTTGEYFRAVPHPVKVLTPHPIDKEEAGFKLLRVYRKTTVKGGNLQITFHDGRNFLLRLKDPMNPVEDVFKTYDTVKMAIPKQEILDHIKMEPGVLALVVDGSHVGFLGRLEDVKTVLKRSRSIVTLKSKDGRVVRTILDYIFAVGREEPLISLPREVVEGV